MHSISQTVRDTSLSGKNIYFQVAVALAFFAIIIIAYVFAGLSLPLFLAVIACAIIFFFPSSDYLGLICIVALTMFFEKIFALQPLVINDSIYKAYPIDALMAIAFIALAINFLVNKKMKLGWPELALGAFLAVVAFNMLRSLVDLNAQFETAFSSFKNYFWYPLVYLLALYSVNTRERFKDIVKIFLFLCVLLIGFIAYGFWSGQGLWTEYTPLSTEGTRILASTHAFYLSIAITISLSLLVADRFQNFLFSLSLMWIWLIGIVGSMMRHLWLALIVSFVTLFIFSTKSAKKGLSKIVFKNTVVIATLALIALLAFNLLPSGGSRQSSNFIESGKNRILSFMSTSDDSSVSWRMGLWSDAIKKWQLSPVFGIGFGKQLSIETYDWQANEDVKNIHNSPLAILAQMGIAGFTLFAIFIFSVLGSSFKYIFEDEELKPYYIGIVASIALCLFASLFQPYLETNMTSIFFWMLLGLLSTSRFLIKQNENPANQ